MASIDQLKGLVNAKNGIARTNLFRVKLPSLPGATSEEMNILCKDVQLPGRQVLTNERRIGLQNQKIPYGYAVTDISFTFHVLNDYGVKEYFETWQNLAVNQNRYEIGYQRGIEGYARQVEIEQFKKVMSLPSRHTSSSSSNGIFPNIGSILNDTEIVQNFYGLADELSDMTVYKVKLIDAYPTTMNAIQLNNDLDGITELNISMSYTNWETPFVLSPSNIKDAIRSKISTSIVGFLNNAF
tara:strand:+ start:885 stop:1607 length:723 start_codon:yes stop_codon:yes gene_type:complete